MRPNIEREVKKNIRLLRAAAKFCTYVYSESHRLRPLEVVRDYETTILPKYRVLRAKVCI